MTIDVMQHFLEKMKEGEDTYTNLKQFRINVDKKHNMKTTFINKKYSLKNLNKRFLPPSNIENIINVSKYFTLDYGYVLPDENQ